MRTAEQSGILKYLVAIADLKIDLMVDVMIDSIIDAMKGVIEALEDEDEMSSYRTQTVVPSQKAIKTDGEEHKQKWVCHLIYTSPLLVPFDQLFFPSSISYSHLGHSYYFYLFYLIYEILLSQLIQTLTRNVILEKLLGRKGSIIDVNGYVSIFSLRGL